MKLFLKSKFTFIIFYLILVVFQIKTTNIAYSYSFTPFEIDQQLQRRNEYLIGRLGNILEVNKIIQVIRKLENNFFIVVDFNEYFPNRLPYILSPFIFIGLYFLINEKREYKLYFNFFVLTVLLLSLFGPYAKYGPLLIYPFFFLFIFITIKKILKIKL